jgi:ribonuclease E
LREPGNEATSQDATTAEGSEPRADEERGEREGGRRRSRDRFRRERRGDDESVQASGPVAAEFAAEPASAAAGEPAVPAEAVETLQAATPMAAAVAGEAGVAAAAVSAPPAIRPAVVEPYVLPLAELERIAQDCGLEWVNSDAAKVAAVQAAIAAEPKPAHVPRERKPVVVIDEGPLVLVETRKDLAQVKLPFEQDAAGTAPTAT